MCQSTTALSQVKVWVTHVHPIIPRKIHNLVIASGAKQSHCYQIGCSRPINGMRSPRQSQDSLLAMTILDYNIQV